MIVEHALKIASHCGKGLGMQGRSAWKKNQWSSMVSRAASGSTSCKMAGPTGPRDVTHESGAVCYPIIPVARAFGQPAHSRSAEVAPTAMDPRAAAET